MEPLCHYMMLFFFSPPLFVTPPYGGGGALATSLVLPEDARQWSQLCERPHLPVGSHHSRHKRSFVFNRKRSSKQEVTFTRFFVRQHPPFWCPSPFFTFCVFYTSTCFSGRVFFVFPSCDMLFFSKRKLRSQHGSFSATECCFVSLVP